MRNLHDVQQIKAAISSGNLAVVQLNGRRGCVSRKDSFLGNTAVTLLEKLLYPSGDTTITFNNGKGTLTQSQLNYSP